MSAFKIGDSLFRPTSNVSKTKKTKATDESKSPALSRSAFDTAGISANPLTVMPRMSSIGGQDTQRLQSEAVESFLRESAAELDDYFTRAYGFDDVPV